jgi:hypothetical protein
MSPLDDDICSDARERFVQLITGKNILLSSAGATPLNALRTYQCATFPWRSWNGVFKV